MDLTWQQQKFKNIIDLNSDKGKAGELIMSYFFQRETGEIFDQKFKFKSKGLFKKRIQILDGEGRSEIALIEYSLFSNKGIIKLSSGEKFLWRCGLKGWAISGNKKLIVDCKGLIFNGTVNYAESSGLLLLSGFYLVSKFLRYPVLLAILLYCYILLLYYHN